MVVIVACFGIVGPYPGPVPDTGGVVLVVFLPFPVYRSAAKDTFRISF